jgi:peptidoglycan/LPS O-acetylase OafA/YrhL
MVRAKKLPYIGALDGLRAVAVCAVLLYHSGLGWFPGGYLGVEVFFVLSGYLITSLLLGEWRETGSIDLRSFWFRRARRLLPELFVVLIVTLAYALVFLHDEVAQLRADALAAAVYITNWRLIFTHQSYFQSLGRPSLLQHLWSLAVEEQFYLAWPPLFALVLRLRRPRLMLAVALGGAVASALLMAWLYTPTLDSSREYYGTDTRAAGVLIGAALAFVWAPWRGAVAAGRARMRAIEGAGLAALLGLALAFLRFDELNPWLYRGGFAAVSLMTALFIAAAVHPQSVTLGRLLGNAPMRWIGTRSYGIYLWHWPVFMVTRPGTDIALNDVVDLALRVAITFVLAELSYRFVAQPVRNGSLLRGLRELYHASGMAAWNVRIAGAGASMAAVAFIVLLADAHVPATPDYLKVPEFHGVVAAAPATQQWPSFLPTPPTDFGTTGPSDTPDDPTATSTTATPVDTTSTAPAETSAPPPPPHGVQSGAGADILAIGDSVMVGAAPYMGVVGAVEIDAVEGRQASSVVSLLRARQAAGTLPRVVIVHTGDNGTFQRSQFDAIMQALSGVQQVIFVNVRVDRSWESSDNAMIAAAVAAYPNATLVDWHAATANLPELFWDDGIHVKPAGASLYANLIAAAIKPPPPPPPPPPTPTPIPPTATPTPSATAVESSTPALTSSTPTKTATSTGSATVTPQASASATGSATATPTEPPSPRLAEQSPSPSPAGGETATPGPSTTPTAQATPTP